MGSSAEPHWPCRFVLSGTLSAGHKHWLAEMDAVGLVSQRYVCASTDVLVVGSDAGAKASAQAQRYGTATWSEQQLSEYVDFERARVSSGGLGRLVVEEQAAALRRATRAASSVTTRKRRRLKKKRRAGTRTAKQTTDSPFSAGVLNVPPTAFERGPGRRLATQAAADAWCAKLAEEITDFVWNHSDIPAWSAAYRMDDVTVKVPATFDWSTHRRVQFEHGGQVHTASVPEGMRPGDTFITSVPPTNDGTGTYRFFKDDCTLELCCAVSQSPMQRNEWRRHPEALSGTCPW